MDARAFDLWARRIDARRAAMVDLYGHWSGEIDLTATIAEEFAQLGSVTAKTLRHMLVVDGDARRARSDELGIRAKKRVIHDASTAPIWKRENRCVHCGALCFLSACVACARLERSVPMLGLFGVKVSFPRPARRAG